MGATMVDANASKPAAGTTEPSDPPARLTAPSPTGYVYETPSEALKKVIEGYHYWTEKLTDTSLQLSIAIIAANWAAFSSVNRILTSFWSKLSVGLVVVAVGFGLVGAKWMGELHRKRIDYAAANPSRWQAEFKDSAEKSDRWPFTRRIVWLGRAMRWVKTWLPLAAGLSFLIALVHH
jgi:hypothetical protein